MYVQGDKYREIWDLSAPHYTSYKYMSVLGCQLGISTPFSCVIIFLGQVQPIAPLWERDTLLSHVCLMAPVMLLCWWWKRKTKVVPAHLFFQFSIVFWVFLG